MQNHWHKYTKPFNYFYFSSFSLFCSVYFLHFFHIIIFNHIYLFCSSSYLFPFWCITDTVINNFKYYTMQTHNDKMQMFENLFHQNAFRISNIILYYKMTKSWGLWADGRAYHLILLGQANKSEINDLWGTWNER